MKNTFSELIHRYNILANDYFAWADYEWMKENYRMIKVDKTELESVTYELAKACVYSVLKKLHKASGSKVIDSMRKQLASDDINARNQFTDTPLFGDSFDLVFEAVITILSETEKQLDRGEATNLEAKYSEKRLSRKVWIKEPDNLAAWKTEETTPIQEVYKAIRRSIEAERSIQSASGKFVYLDDVLTDDDGNTDSYYHRLPLYYDIGGQMVDKNSFYLAGQPNSLTVSDNDIYTVHSSDYADAETIVSRLNLSKRESEILHYRRKGHGKKAIATALGMDERNVYTLLKRIQKKAIAIGLFEE